MILEQVDPDPLPLFALVPWVQTPRGWVGLATVMAHAYH